MSYEALEELWSKLKYHRYYWLLIKLSIFAAKFAVLIVSIDKKLAEALLSTTV